MLNSANSNCKHLSLLFLLIQIIFPVYNINIEYYRGDDENGITRVERKKRRDLFGVFE